MGGVIKSQTKHNYFIKISSSKFEFFREKLTFWPLFDLQWPPNCRIFYHHLPDWRENWTWYFGASSAPFQLVKLKIQAFWFSIFYHFRHFLRSLGGPGTLLCALNLKIRLNFLINELCKMLNNSTKKHSFWKSDYRNEIHPFKKTEKFINRNYRLWENPRFLIWQPFWPWMTSITSWNRVCYVFSILKDTSPPDQHFDTKLVVFNELWVFLWSVSLPPIPLFLNICVLQVADYLICGWSVWPGLTQIWPCPKVGARHFDRPHILPYPPKVKNSIYMGG